VPRSSSPARCGADPQAEHHALAQGGARAGHISYPAAAAAGSSGGVLLHHRAAVRGVYRKWGGYGPATPSCSSRRGLTSWRSPTPAACWAGIRHRALPAVPAVRHRYHFASALLFWRARPAPRRANRCAVRNRPHRPDGHAAALACWPCWCGTLKLWPLTPRLPRCTCPVGGPRPEGMLLALVPFDARKGEGEV